MHRPVYFESRTSWNRTVAGGAPVVIWGVNGRQSGGDSLQLNDQNSSGAQVIEMDFSGSDGMFNYDFGITFPNGCYVSMAHPATIFYSLIQ